MSNINGIMMSATPPMETAVRYIVRAPTRANEYHELAVSFFLSKIILSTPLGWYLRINGMWNTFVAHLVILLIDMIRK